MVVPLPIGEPDHVRRLQLIAAETAKRKNKAHPQMGSGIFRLAVVQRAFVRLLARQRLMNVTVTNVPGPPVPLYLAGAPRAGPPLSVEALSAVRFSGGGVHRPPRERMGARAFASAHISGRGRY